MLQLIKRGTRRLLGPQVTAVLKRLLAGRSAPVGQPAPAEVDPAPEVAAAPEAVLAGAPAMTAEPEAAPLPLPHAAPARPPKKLLFLSDCYTPGTGWAPF